MDAMTSFMVLSSHVIHICSSVLFVYVSLQLSGFKKVVNYTKKVMEDVSILPGSLPLCLVSKVNCNQMG